MTGVLTITKYSLLEIIKGKVFKILLIFPIILLIITCGFGYWTMFHTDEIERSIQYSPTVRDQYGHSSDFQVAKDQLVRTYVGTILSVFVIYPIYIFFGNLLVVFNSVGLMSPELERRSIYTLISKPLSRSMIYLGKFFGVIAAQLIFAIVLLLTTQILLMLSGAGFYPGLFPAFIVGFLNFIIFAGVALFFASWSKSIAAAVLSLVFLASSSNAGMTMTELIGKEVFKFGHWVDFTLSILPQQRKIGQFANSFSLDKYQKMFIDDFPYEFSEFGFLKFITDDPSVLIQPVAWIVVILFIGLRGFYRKEFD